MKISCFVLNISDPFLQPKICTTKKIGQHVENIGRIFVNSLLVWVLVSDTFKNLEKDTFFKFSNSFKIHSYHLSSSKNKLSNCIGFLRLS